MVKKDWRRINTVDIGEGERKRKREARKIQSEGKDKERFKWESLTPDRERENNRMKVNQKWGEKNDLNKYGWR